jgi:hypothetical protein
MFSDHYRAVSIAHARAARQQRVFVCDVGVRMNGDGGNVQLAAPRPLIQRLNVFQPMFKLITAQIDFVLRYRIEHEGIVRIGRMA